MKTLQKYSPNLFWNPGWNHCKNTLQTFFEIQEETIVKILSKPFLKSRMEPLQKYFPNLLWNPGWNYCKNILQTFWKSRMKPLKKYSPDLFWDAGLNYCKNSLQTFLKSLKSRIELMQKFSPNLFEVFEIQNESNAKILSKPPTARNPLRARVKAGQKRGRRSEYGRLFNAMNLSCRISVDNMTLSPLKWELSIFEVSSLKSLYCTLNGRKQGYHHNSVHIWKRLQSRKHLSFWLDWSQCLF